MTKRLKFGKFRQRMCDLLWETNCDHLALSDETNAKQIFNNAHYICNKLLEEYNISEKEVENRLKQAIHEINDYTCTIKQLQDKIGAKEALLKQYEEEYEELKSRCGAVMEELRLADEENKQLRQQIKNLRTTVLDSIHEADDVQCNCNPCVVEKYVKKVVE